MQPIHRNYSNPQEIVMIHQPWYLVRRYQIIAVAIALILVIALSSVIGGGNNQKKEVLAATTTNQSDDAKPPKNLSKVDTSRLSSNLETVLKKYPQYDTSVSVVELSSGNVIQAGDSYPFVAASTTKLLTALLFFNNVESGQASLRNYIENEQAGELMKRMINQSDNDAWAKMNNNLTKESLGAYAKKQGVSSYDPEKNTITSNDMALLVAKLYKGDLINEEHTKLLYSWMQNTSEERYIPQAVPKSVPLYHKAGYLEDRVHEVAIVDKGTTPFVIVIYSKTFGNAKYDYEKAQQLFAEVTQQALTTFK